MVHAALGDLQGSPPFPTQDSALSELLHPALQGTRGISPLPVNGYEMKSLFCQLLEVIKPPCNPWLYPAFTNIVQIFKKKHLRSVKQQHGAVHQADKNSSLSMEPMADVMTRIDDSRQLWLKAMPFLSPERLQW